MDQKAATPRVGPGADTQKATALVMVAAALLLLLSLALFWPGYALYDTVAQFDQVLTDDYSDWHPPAMARLWSVFNAMGLGGGGPMLVLQMTLYWTGFTLIASTLARQGRRLSAIVVLLIGIWPPFLGWQAAILKDAQMTGALLAGVGLIAWVRLRDRRVPPWAWCLASLLFGYATLVRANAVFATVPLIVALLPQVRLHTRFGIGLAAIPLIILASGPINHDLMAASDSGVVRTQALYDLAGIAVRTPSAHDLPFDAAQLHALSARHCVKPFFWDPLGSPEQCDGVVEPLRHVPPVILYEDLAAAILHHPVAYVAHRLAHLNSTDRWLVPVGWPSAIPPQVIEPNNEGLTSPGSSAKSFQRMAAWLAETPFAWPSAWIAATIAALAIALRRPPGAARDVAFALLASTATLELSFAVLSIASDLRYHLWSMIGTALAIALLWTPRRCERRTFTVGAAGVFAVIAAGTAARLFLPHAPTSYAAMLAQP